MELQDLSAGAATIRENISGIENLANEWRRYSRGKPTTLRPEIMAIATVEVLGLIPALLAEIERLQAERNGHAITLATQRKVADLEAENERLRAEVAELKADGEKFLAEVTTMHLGLNGERVEVQTKNERLQGVLRMVDDWIAATLPGSSSEAIRALIAEVLQGGEKTTADFYLAPVRRCTCGDGGSYNIQFCPMHGQRR